MVSLNKIISPEKQEILVKRFKSFAWRVSNLVLVAAVAFAAENLQLFELPAWAQAFVGLMLGEVTKYLNSKK